MGTFTSVVDTKVSIPVADDFISVQIESVPLATANVAAYNDQISPKGSWKTKCRGRLRALSA